MEFVERNDIQTKSTEQEMPIQPEAPAIIEDAAQHDAAPEASAIIEDAAAVTPAKESRKPEAKKDPEGYVRFSKPFTFEGKTYAGVDLSAIDQMSAQDMCDAEKYLTRLGILSPLPEMTMEYIGFIANRATGQPVEFFKSLPPKDATKVKNKVTSFFYGED